MTLNMFPQRHNGLPFFLSIILFVVSVDAMGRWKRSQRRDQIFEYGKASLYFWNDRYVEDLYWNQDPLPQTDLQELGLSFFMANQTSGSATPSQVYSRAIWNLRQAAPNLQILWLIGGHHFNPYYKTSNSFYNEILFLMENLRELTKNLQGSKFRIYSHSREVPRDMNSIRYIMFAHMTEEFIRSGQHLRIIQQLLGHQATAREIYDRYFTVIKEWNGVKVYLELGFFNEQDTDFPSGRSRFKDGQVKDLIIS